MDDASQRSRMAPSVVVWGLLACLVGSLVGSLLLPLALTTIELLARSSSGDDSPLETWGHVFELSAMAFGFATAICILGLPLLWLLLHIHRRVAMGRPSLERSWSAIARSCVALAALAAVGIALPLAFLSPSWDLGDFLFMALPVGLSAFLGLLGARWLHPDLWPGSLIAARPRARIVPPFRPFAFAALLALLISSATALLRSDMDLACADSSDSCTERVEVRGFPYPFWRRTFDPVAFGYDALVFGFLAVAAARAAAGGRGAP